MNRITKRNEQPTTTIPTNLQFNMTEYEYYKMKYCQLKIKRREAERISSEIYEIQKELNACDEATYTKIVREISEQEESDLMAKGIPTYAPTKKYADNLTKAHLTYADLQKIIRGN